MSWGRPPHNLFSWFFLLLLLSRVMLLRLPSRFFIQFPVKRSFHIEMYQDTRTRKFLNRDGSHQSAVIQLTLSIPQRRIISIYTITQAILAF